MVFINVIGRLGADAEVRTTERGSFVVLRVAVDDSLSSATKVTSWFSVTIDKSEISDRFLACLTKGTLVNVYGRETLNTYQDRNGETQIGRRIFADSVRLIPTSSSGETTTSQTVTENVTRPTTTTTTTPSTTVNPTATVTAEAMSCGTFTQPVVAASVSASVSDNPEDDLPF